MARLNPFHPWFLLTPGGGGGTPGGSTTQVQFNDGGGFGGDANFTWNKTASSRTLTIGTIVGNGGNYGILSGGNLNSPNGFIIAGERNLSFFANWGNFSDGKIYTFSPLVISDGAKAALLDTSQLSSSDKTFTFPNISGTFTMAVGHARATAQVAANTNVLTYTVGAADATFQVMANVLVTTSTTHSITVTVDYTDESNVARTVTMPFAQLAGTLITAITNVTGAGPYEGLDLTIRAKSGTNIVFKTAGTFTSIAYNVDASIVQIATT